MIKQTCPYCDKEVEGYSEKQAEKMIEQHILGKHRSKVAIKDEEKTKDYTQRHEKTKEEQKVEKPTKTNSEYWGF